MPMADVSEDKYFFGKLFSAGAPLLQRHGVFNPIQAHFP
jgi:hypothetical protein